MSYIEAGMYIKPSEQGLRSHPRHWTRDKKYLIYEWPSSRELFVKTDMDAKLDLLAYPTHWTLVRQHIVVGGEVI